jgi:hypothetical protein
MARRLPTAPPDELMRAAQTLLYNRDEVARTTGLKDRARALLKGWLTMKDANGKFANGRVDENGHRYYDFPAPVTINDTAYTGIRAQRNTSSYIDIDAVAKLLKARADDSYDIVFKRKVIRQFDEDALFVLNQKGVISDDELEALTVEDEAYSIVPVKE